MVVLRPKQVGDEFEFRGTIESAWNRTDDSFRLLAVVPPNTSALISVPVTGDDIAIKEGRDTVWEDCAFVPGTAGIVSARRDGDYVTLAAGSGRYIFTTGPEQT